MVTDHALLKSNESSIQGLKEYCMSKLEAEVVHIGRGRRTTELEIENNDWTYGKFSSMAVELPQ